MAPIVLASFPAFPALPLAGSLPYYSSTDPILPKGRDPLFDDDDYLPHEPVPRRPRSNTSFSSCASRLTRRISRGSSSFSSSSSSSSFSSPRTGRGLTKGARSFIGNLFRSRPSENEWRRVEEEIAAARHLQEQQPVIPFLTRMADGYTCFDRSTTAPTTTPWKRLSRRGTTTNVTRSRFYEHTDDHDDYNPEDDEALTPLFRCPAGLSMTPAATESPLLEDQGRERKLSMSDGWAWW